MIITDDDISVILPALDVYIEYMETLATKAENTAPALQEAADKAKAVADKIVSFEVY